MRKISPTATAAKPPMSFAALERFLSRSKGIIFLATREPRVLSGRGSLVVDVAMPTTLEQTKAWADEFGPLVESEVPGELAAQFSLDRATIHRIAVEAVKCGPAESGALHDLAWYACRRTVRTRLESLAERIDVKASWDDIVLPKDAVDLLEQIVDQVRFRGVVYEDWGFARTMNRGLGISVLFAGDSGTGKTMAAEVLANELKLDLFRIDLASVVSKYIGETEKNLRSLFDAAESGGAILFFDEADALFGRRSEVKDSHDRYANIEIDYLLQRMESYRGVAILATNMKAAIDDAFLRRLRFVVDFPFPVVADRKTMWTKVLPPPTGDYDEVEDVPAHVPVGVLDYDRLAKLDLTGASIRSVALGAAFLAAASPKKLLTMRELCRAIRAEYSKLGRRVQDVDFCRKLLAEAKP